METLALSELGVTQDGDGYVDASGCSFDDLESVILDGVFGFHGYHNPGAFLSLARNVLCLMSERRDDEVEPDKYQSEMTAICGNKGSMWFLISAFDRLGIVEHCGNVSSAWLTPKGYALLKAIEALDGG